MENCCISLQEMGAEPADWQGFQGWRILLGEQWLRIVLPKEFAAGRPWTWRPEFFEPFAATDVMLLEKGWARVFLDLPDHYGSPKAIERFEEMVRFVTGELGLAPKMGIIALSRAGLSAYRYAAVHPEQVCAIYADNPVCDFRSWPAGRGQGIGSTEDWEKLLAVYELTEEEALAYQAQPFSKEVLAPIAKAGIPVFHVCGDSDQTVSYEENTCRLRDQFQDLGGSFAEIVKPGADHHPHGLEDPTPVVDFLIRSFRR